MNTLLDKLQPKQEFELLKKRKPATYKKISKFLKKSKFWYELSTENSQILCYEFQVEQSMSSVINLFKPVKE